MAPRMARASKIKERKMTNKEFHQLQTLIRYHQNELRALQKQHSAQTGREMQITDSIQPLRECYTCLHAVNNGLIVCTNDDSEYFDQNITQGCIEHTERD